MRVVRVVLAVLAGLYGVGWASTVVNWSVPHEIVRSSPGVYQSTGATVQATINPYRGKITLSVAYDPAVIVKLPYRGRAERVSASELRLGSVRVRALGDALEVRGPCSVRPYVTTRTGEAYTVELARLGGGFVGLNRSGYLVIVTRSGSVTRVRVLPLVPLI
ncbi:hypothetical protein [Methanopyrus sp.]